MDMHLQGKKDHVVAFIGGTGRSGTNILREILDQHSGTVSLPFEYRFIIDPDGIVDFYLASSGSWSPFLMDRRLKRLEVLLMQLSKRTSLAQLAGRLISWLDPRGRWFTPQSYWGYELDQHIQGFSDMAHELIGSLREFSYRGSWVGASSYTHNHCIYHASRKGKDDLLALLQQFLQNVFQTLWNESGTRVYVEDNTWNILLAKELLDLVPNGRIVHIYRDPRDVVASLTKQRWAPSNAIEAAAWYSSIMEEWYRVRADLAEASLLEFSLESLVDDPEKVLRGLCSFLNIQMEPAFLQLELTKANSGRWKRDFSTSIQHKLNQELRPHIERLGYE
jgi:sulfotransferase family protein